VEANNKCKSTAPHKPDIIVCNNENGTCMSIDSETSTGRNMVKKQAQKIVKYEYLITEIQCTWKINTKVKPITVGSTEAISKS
jgi:hypothetical protein